MATQCFLVSGNLYDGHLGDNSLRIDGTNSDWITLGVSTTRGTSMSASANTPTVDGATDGIENATGTFAYEYISHPVAADVTISGIITLNIWASESNMLANVAINALIEVIRAADNSREMILKSARTTEVAVTTRAVNNFTATPTSLLVKKGDRLRIRIFGDDAGTMNAGHTFNVSYNGPTAGSDGDTYITFTENFSFDTADPTGTKLYLTQNASVVSTASLDLEAWTSPGTLLDTNTTNTAAGYTAPIQITESAGGTPVDWFTRPLSAFTLGGRAMMKAWVNESNSAANACIRTEIAVVNNDGTSPVVWGSWCAPSELPISASHHTGYLSGNDLSVSNGQRLRIRLYLDDFANGQTPMASGYQVVLYYSEDTPNASGDTYVILPQTVSEFTGAASYQPRHPAIDFGDPGLLMKGIRRAWHRRRSGIFVPDLWTPKGAIA